MPTSVILLGRMAASASECLTAELGDNARITSVCDPRAADNQLGTFAAAEVIVVGPLTADR